MRGATVWKRARGGAKKLKLEDALKSSLLAEHPLSWVCVGETLEDAVSGSVTAKSTLQVRLPP